MIDGIYSLTGDGVKFTPWDKVSDETRIDLEWALMNEDGEIVE